LDVEKADLKRLETFEMTAARILRPIRVSLNTSWD